MSGGGLHQMSQPAAGLRAVVVESWPLLRQGVVAVLSRARVSVAVQTATAADALSAVRHRQPDLAVIGSTADLTLPETLARAKELRPGIRTVGLLATASGATVRDALAAGADALVTNLASVDELTDAVNRVAAGEHHLSLAAITALAGSTAGTETESVGPLHAHLTAKEREVLSLLIAGLSNREIAGSLFVSVPTVKTHVAHIYGKLGAASRRDAVRMAVEAGLVG
ncbi:MAG: response regulator transcription factor [Acidimicrobiales bacterium]